MGARCGDVIRHVTGQRDHFAFNVSALFKHLIFDSYIISVLTFLKRPLQISCIYTPSICLRADGDLVIAGGSDKNRCSSNNDHGNNSGSRC
jgi:hypothetical protein